MKNNKQLQEIKKRLLTKSSGWSKDKDLVKKINTLNNKELIYLIESTPVQLLQIIKSPSIAIQSHIAKKHPTFYILLQRKDFESLKFCINQYKEKPTLVKFLVQSFYKNRVPNLEELLYLANKALPLLSIFKNINKEDEIELSKKCPDVALSLKNPQNETILNFVIRHPKNFVYIDTVLTDEMYVFFFTKHPKVKISDEFYVNTTIPIHIVMKHLKCFYKDGIEKYVSLILRRRNGFTSEQLSFFHHNINNTKIRNRIERKTNYLDSASLVLKQIEDESFIENLNLISMITKLDQIDLNNCPQAILDIIMVLNSSKKEDVLKEIVNIVSSLKK